MSFKLQINLLSLCTKGFSFYMSPQTSVFQSQLSELLYIELYHASPENFSFRMRLSYLIRQYLTQRYVLERI